MRNFIIVLFFLSFSMLMANPIALVFISEIYFEGDNWTIELYDYYESGISSLDNYCIMSSSDSTYFNNGIYFEPGEVILVTEEDLQSSLSINKGGDFVLIFGNNFDDLVQFGDYAYSNVNSPYEGQSLARIVLCSDMPPFGDIYFLLAKENQPTLGSDPFTLSTSGTFTGYVYDSLMNPVPNVDIDMTPDLGIDYAYIETDYTGYFSTSLPGMNYEFDIHLAALASLDTTITIEPDSIHFYEFIFENYVNSDNNEISLPASFYNLSNHPNPFNPSTTISFDLTAKSAKVEIYNSKGQKVYELLIPNGQSVSAGLKSSITWEADNFPSGVYLYKLVIDGKEVANNKMLLLK